MKNRSARWWLVLIALETVIGGAAVARRAARPRPPDLGLTRLPVMTAADVAPLRERTRSDLPADWYELGSALMAYGYIPDAEACLRHAASLEPSNFDIVFAHGWSLDRLGRIPEAVATFEKAAQLSPGARAETCRYYVGLLKLRAEDPAGADAAFEKAGPDNPPAVLARARLRIREGRPADAIPLVEGLRGRLPPDVRTEMVAERMYRELNRPAKAREAIERSERSREYIRVWDQMAYMESIRARYGLPARGDPQAASTAEALVRYEAIVRSERPDFTERMYEPMADWALSSGRPDLAQDLLTRLADRMSLTPSARHLEAAVCLSQGDEKRSIELWLKANEIRPNAFSHKSLSILLRKRGNQAESDRQIALASLREGILLYQTNKVAEARGFLERARAGLSDDPLPDFYLGEIELGEGHPAKAEEAYRRCLAINPNYGRAGDRLAMSSSTK